LLYLELSRRTPTHGHRISFISIQRDQPLQLLDGEADRINFGCLIGSYCADSQKLEMGARKIRSYFFAIL